MNKFLITILLSILFFNIAFSQDGSSSDITDVDQFCYGTTKETCRNAGACCFWCSPDAPDAVAPTGGICFFVPYLVDCPADVSPMCLAKSNETIVSQCTCNLRATATNNSNSFMSNISFITTFLLSISTCLL